MDGLTLVANDNHVPPPLSHGAQLYLSDVSDYYLALAAEDICHLIGQMATIAPSNPITPGFILTGCRYWARLAYCELIYAASIPYRRVPTVEECATLVGGLS